jgi:hypothetical protein
MDVMQLALAIGSIVGAAGAVTYWGGRIARSVEQIAEQIAALRTDISAHSGIISEHGERIARVETRQEVAL